MKFPEWLLIWVRSRNCGCLVTWFCYHLIAKPGNKTATVPWPNPYAHWLPVIWKISSCIPSSELHSRFGYRLPRRVYFTWCYQRSVYLFTSARLLARSRLASYFMMDFCGVELNSMLCKWYLSFHLVNMGMFNYITASVFWLHIINIKQVDCPMMLICSTLLT